MSSDILQKLETKIDNAIETIELLRLQIEELESKNEKLILENSSIKERQAAWGENLNIMLNKLDSIDSETTIERDTTKQVHAEAEIA